MALGSPKISEIYIVSNIWLCMNAGNLKPRRGLYPFCTIPRIIFLCSASLKLSFDVNIVLVQTRYHGDRKPRNFGNLHGRSYMAMHECGYFEAPKRFVPFLHQPKDNIFGLCIPKAPF